MLLNATALVFFIIAMIKQGGIFPKSKEQQSEGRPYTLAGWVFLIAYFLM
jgi:hypothetical protein